MRRGQNLVLFSLFLLLLCVAVMGTIGVTQQIRRKLELDTTADASAYSQAVATARTFNSIALLNRAQVATMVAMTGAQSAISFAATYRATLDAARAGYRKQWQDEYCGGFECGEPGLFVQYCKPQGFAQTPGLYSCKNSHLGSWCPAQGRPKPPPGMGCVGKSCPVAPEIQKRDMILGDELRRIRGQWVALDTLAGHEVLAIQSEAFMLGIAQRTALRQLEGTSFPQVLQSSGASLEHQLSSREVTHAVAPGSVLDSAKVAMGSRRHYFITQRLDGARVLQNALDLAMRPSGVAGELTVGALKGNGYFATSLNHGNDVSEFAGWADEHAALSVDYLGPRAGIGSPGSGSAVQFGGWAESTDKQDTGDMHDHCPKVSLSPDELEGTPPSEDHTLRPHQDQPVDTCPNSSCIWPDLLDINPAVLSDVADAFGQPKAQVTAGLPVDPRAPWNLNFRFGFTRAGATINLRGDRSVGQVSPTPQMVSTAMAYYHRPGHWKEPPNLYNPFWRAVLVRADVDDASLGDLQTGLRTSAPWASDAVRKLMAAGYRGIP